MPASDVGVNVEQTRGWDGPDGDNWTENEDWYNAAARYVTPPLFTAAAIQPDERVLDIGCGTGETTREAARRAPSGSAFGVDLSGRMIERARERASQEGLGNVRFEQGDAQVYGFEPKSFDVAISRYGSMFFDDPIAAFTNISTALRPGGRVVMLCWRELARNEWVSELRAALDAGRNLPEPPPLAPSPFAFADPERVRNVLTSAGLSDVLLEPLERPMYFGPDAVSAFESLEKIGIVKGMLAELGDQARHHALDRLRTTISKHETNDGVLFDAAAWIVRAGRAGEGEAFA